LAYERDIRSRNPREKLLYKILLMLAREGSGFFLGIHCRTKNNETNAVMIVPTKKDTTYAYKEVDRGEK
jgi:hypothetical protein